MGVPVEVEVSIDVDIPVDAIPPQPLVSTVAYAALPPTIPAAARTLNRSNPARESPRGGGTGAGLDARDSGHVTPQKGQRASVSRMWREQEGQATRYIGIGGVCAEGRAKQGLTFHFEMRWMYVLPDLVVPLRPLDGIPGHLHREPSSRGIREFPTRHLPLNRLDTVGVTGSIPGARSARSSSSSDLRDRDGRNPHRACVFGRTARAVPTPFALRILKPATHVGFTCHTH
jgi:hypothetical protein